MAVSKVRLAKRFQAAIASQVSNRENRPAAKIKLFITTLKIRPYYRGIDTSSKQRRRWVRFNYNLKESNETPKRNCRFAKPRKQRKSRTLTSHHFFGKPDQGTHKIEALKAPPISWPHRDAPMPCSHWRSSPVWAMAENGQQSHFCVMSPPIRKASQVACCWFSASWAALLAFLW